MKKSPFEIRSALTRGEGEGIKTLYFNRGQPLCKGLQEGLKRSNVPWLNHSVISLGLVNLI